MKRIDAIIQPQKLDAVREAIERVGHCGMTVCDVRGQGRQKGQKEVYRGQEYEVDLLPKVLVIVFLQDEMVETVRRAILEAARTGRIGDGKIIESDIVQATRIRNREGGETALT